MDHSPAAMASFERLFSPHTGLPDFRTLRPEDALAALQDLVAGYRHDTERRLAAGETPGWAFVEAEAAWSDRIARAWSPLGLLSVVSDSETLRPVYNEALQLLTGHETWRQQHAGLCAVYRAMHNAPDFAQLSPVQRRIVELEVRDFHLAGVDLDEAGRAEYREIVLRISHLGTRFQENLLDATAAWTRSFDDPAGLEGLPEAELRLLAGIAAAHGRQGWLVDLSDPAYNAVMTHARDATLRQEVYTAFVTRASDQGPHAGRWDNTPVMRELLALRHRLARLLGFANYAEYALATRMVSEPGRVIDFLGGLAQRAVPAARAQLEELQRFAEREGATLPLQPWDIAWWAERYRDSELQLSDEALKPYFPLDSILGALWHVAGRVFGVSQEADDSVPLWHPDARFFWLHDRDGRRIAGLYMDLHARRNKRGGAWMDVCRSRRRLETGLQVPVAYLNCNFPAPAAGHPCLLTHYDVQTLFHEFGHCLHHMLTEVDWPQVNGIANVEWDAVELPSQLLENWCWEEHLLDGFCRHHESGQLLPDELRRRLLRSRQFHKALVLVRQLEYALCDFRLHLEYDPAQPRDPLDVLQEVRRGCAVVDVPQWNRFLHGFGHIFGGGYSAGYYSYLWAEQLAADAWDRFLEEGPFNEATGQSLRREIFAMGAARPAAESFRAFRGRAPIADPLLRSYGLT